MQVVSQTDVSQPWEAELQGRKEAGFGAVAAKVIAWVDLAWGGRRMADASNAS